MDTKLKNNRKVWIVVSLAVIALCAGILFLFYPMFEKTGEKAKDEVYNGSEYLSELLTPLLKGNYVLYNQVSKEMDESRLREEMDLSGFRMLQKYMDYAVYDKSGDAALSSGTAAENKLKLRGDAGYALKIEFSFDDEGGLADVQVESNYLEANEEYLIEEALLSGQKGMENRWAESSAWLMTVPRDVTVIYGISRTALEECVSSDLAMDAYGGSYVYGKWIVESAGFMWVMLAAVCLAGAAGWIVRSFYPGGTKWFHIPVELILLFLVLLSGAATWMGIMIWKTCSGTFFTLSGKSGLDTLFAYNLNFLVWFLYFAMVFWIAGSVRDLFMEKEAWRRSVILSFIVWQWKGDQSMAESLRKKMISLAGGCGRFLRKQYEALLHLDFRDKTSRLILKIVAGNFILLLLISVCWFLHPWSLVFYSVFLFIFLKRYLNRIRKQYEQLLGNTSALAEGKLEQPIEGETGIFMPVQEELKKIQAGFRKAVEREVKSERMKTDLVTNVSHDLKTPLTAIITYVDLLKTEKDEEKKKEYIQVLEKKSQRLKVLIEDLFEISRATSNNVTLHLVDLDLIGLLKQVVLEYDKDLTEAGLTVRWELPEDRMILKLDSQKTYRIFENLIVNITKYSLPGTRVFIGALLEGREAVIYMKNVSACELTFNMEEITDRFVRGDVSRNTEGSGLGLAIVKSFTELMHGTLHITSEADLFRAEIRFPKS